LNDTSLITEDKNKVSGTLYFNQKVIDDGAKGYDED
jgi:hypothetical protein